MMDFRRCRLSDHAVKSIHTPMGMVEYTRYGAGKPSPIVFAAMYKKQVKKMILALAVRMKWHEENDKTNRVAKTVFHPLRAKFITV